MMDKVSRVVTVIFSVCWAIFFVTYITGVFEPLPITVAASFLTSALAFVREYSLLRKEAEE